MSAEEEFIDFVVGALMRGESVDSIVSILVAGGMEEGDARAAVTNIAEQLRSSEFSEIMEAIERELQSGKSVDEVVAGIVETGIPDEKARPVVLMLAMQLLMKQGAAEAFMGSLINAMRIVGERKELEENLENFGIPADVISGALEGIEALAAPVEKQGRGENIGLEVMREFVAAKEAIEAGKEEEFVEALTARGFDRTTMENFIRAADYFITLEKNARDKDVEEKNEQGRTE